MARQFEYFIAIDWSGARGSHHRGIAMAIAHAAGGAPVLVERSRGWSREEVLSVLRDDLPHSSLVGMDLGISLPFADADAFFPGWERSPANARELWALVDDICAQDPHLEATSFVQHTEAARYFRHSKEHVGDRFHLPDAATREGRFRRAEQAQRRQGVRPVSNFNLVGAAQVGKSSLTGMRMLNRLAGQISVWPIDPLPESGPVLVEMYTSIAARGGGVGNLKGGGKTKLRSHEDLNTALAMLGSPPIQAAGPIDDHSSDAIVTAAWLRTVAHRPEHWAPSGLTSEIAQTEGWTFGAV